MKKRKRRNDRKLCRALDLKLRDSKCACSVGIRIFRFFFSLCSFILFFAGAPCVVGILATNSQNRNIDTGQTKTVASLATIVFSCYTYSKDTSAWKWIRLSLECRTKSNWNLLEQIFRFDPFSFVYFGRIWIVWLCNECTAQPAHTIHSKMKTKNEAIENESSWLPWCYLRNHLPLNLSTPNATELFNSHSRNENRPSFIFAWILRVFFPCGWFDWSACGACTFDSLAVWITIPRFFLCVSAFGCTMPMRHFGLPFFYARRRRIALAGGTDWYAATDNVSLFFFFRFSFTFLFVCTRLKWNRNRLCEPCSARTHPLSISQCSIARIIYFYFSFTGTITENISLFLVVFFSVFSFAKVARHFEWRQLDSAGVWCTRSARLSGRRHVIPMTQRRHMSINHEVFCAHLDVVWDINAQLQMHGRIAGE